MCRSPPRAKIKAAIAGKCFELASGRRPFRLEPLFRYGRCNFAGGPQRRIDLSIAILSDLLPANGYENAILCLDDFGRVPKKSPSVPGSVPCFMIRGSALPRHLFHFFAPVRI